MSTRINRATYYYLFGVYLFAIYAYVMPETTLSYILILMNFILYTGIYIDYRSRFLKMRR